MIDSFRVWVTSKQRELLPAASLRSRSRPAPFGPSPQRYSRGPVLAASVACARLLRRVMTPLANASSLSILDIFVLQK